MSGLSGLSGSIGFLCLLLCAFVFYFCQYALDIKGAADWAVQQSSTVLEPMSHNGRRSVGDAPVSLASHGSTSNAPAAGGEGSSGATSLAAVSSESDVPASAGASDAPTSAGGARSGATERRAKYGFYIHAFNRLPAVKYQVRKVKEFFPGAPIYIMSDGGDQFDGLCKLEGCTFVLCPPANDRWHPWPFIRRLYDAAVVMDAEYVIMLEPDNTIHGPITRPPTHDAGGIFSEKRRFAAREYVERLAQEVKPGFKWKEHSMEAGLAGGSYFRTEAILDAFSDENVARLDWNFLASGRKHIFSSDFAMPYLLAARGYEFYPWEECAQMDKDPNVPLTGPADATFRHYSRGFPGGKPTYNLKFVPEDKDLVKPPPVEYQSSAVTCQLCYNLTEYVERWGSARCTNRLPFDYAAEFMEIRNRGHHHSGHPAPAPATEPAPAPAVAVTPAVAAPLEAMQPTVQGTSAKRVAKYGFYVHCFNKLPAVKYQVQKLQQYFPGSPIYIMSDGGEDFSGLCAQFGCTFMLCPPANDRWHPWPFLRRLYDAAVSLNTEYVIMLEPDNTIHGGIKRPPTHDAGGIFSEKRRFGEKAYIESLAHKVKPGFEWQPHSMEAGLAGGSYFKTDVILDAFSDESVRDLDWNFLARGGKRHLFSSDFAMPYLLAAKGYEFYPWQEVAQMDRDPDKPLTGPADAAFRHYSRGFPGGKPTYNLKMAPGDEELSKPSKYYSERWWSNCQMCWNLTDYVRRWGSSRCTNHYPFEYSEELRQHKR